MVYEALIPGYFYQEYKETISINLNAVFWAKGVIFTCLEYF